jgi:hypothetical protein
MSCLQHDFCNMMFKIKHELYMALGSLPPLPPKRKILGAHVPQTVKLLRGIGSWVCAFRRGERNAYSCLPKCTLSHLKIPNAVRNSDPSKRFIFMYTFVAAFCLEYSDCWKLMLDADTHCTDLIIILIKTVIVFVRFLLHSSYSCSLEHPVDSAQSYQYFVYKNIYHQQMHKESCIINCNTLLHVSTLLGHLQRELSVIVTLRLYFTVEWECAVDCVLEARTTDSSRLQYTVNSTFTLNYKMQPYCNDKIVLPGDDPAGSKHVGVCYNWW